MNVVNEYLEDQRKHYVEPLEAIIAKFNSDSGIALELHPAYTPALRRAGSAYVDYKLHERGTAMNRILNLLIFETEYTMDSSGRWSFQPEAAEQITFQIRSFWDGERTDQVFTSYIPAQP